LAFARAPFSQFIHRNRFLTPNAVYHLTRAELEHPRYTPTVRVVSVTDAANEKDHDEHDDVDTVIHVSLPVVVLYTTFTSFIEFKEGTNDSRFLTYSFFLHSFFSLSFRMA
jgi:hypothetical protein